MIDVCLLGTGGMMPLPYRYLTSLIVRIGGSSLLIDCGEGTQVALRKKGWSPKPIDVMLFTHFHADHISGLPGMLLTMGNADRTEPLLMIGPKGLERVVKSLLVIAPELPFPILFKELSDPEESFPYPGQEDVTLHAFKVKHNVPCYGYGITMSRKGKFDLAAAESLKIPRQYWNKLQHGETVEENGTLYTPDMVMGAPRKGLKLVYTTDTRPCDAIASAAKDADLFICEGMYGEPGMEEKAKDHKHMTFAEAAQLAKEAEVREMWLTHYSPSLVKPDPFLPEVRTIFENTKAGKDGKSVTLRFEEEED
ncbi:MAG: ribonuclease Z [Lachnospiraceae bacterium]|nr:ribonuclease Z [Lachnospiraceae bacterium]